VTQNCVFDTDTRGSATNIVLYARRLSSIAQSFEQHGKFSGDPEAAVRSYNASLIKLTRSSQMLVIDNLSCKNPLLIISYKHHKYFTTKLSHCYHILYMTHLQQEITKAYEHRCSKTDK